MTKDTPPPIFLPAPPGSAAATIHTIVCQNHAVERIQWVPWTTQTPKKNQDGPEVVVGKTSLSPDGRNCPVFRHPLQRSLSPFFRRWEANNTSSKDLDRSARAFVEEEIGSGMLSNPMTRLLADELIGEPTRDTLDRARERLQRLCAAVIIVERLEESVLLAASQLGWLRPYFISQNVHTLTLGDLSQQTIAACQQRQSLDIELYDFAQELFEGLLAKQDIPAFATARSAMGRLQSRLHQHYEPQQHKAKDAAPDLPSELKHARQHGFGNVFGEKRFYTDENCVRDYLTHKEPETTHTKPWKPVEPPPLVGVITRTKDRPLLLWRALDSVANQTYRHIDWVIVNDGGDPDPVRRIVARAKARNIRVRLVNNPESIGMEAASNRGVKATHAPLIVIHDDDDSWSEEFLSRTVQFLHDNPVYAGVTSQSIRVDEVVEESGVRIVNRVPYNEGLWAIHLADMAIVNRFPPISFLFSRELYESLGGYDESLPVLGDWDFNLRFLEKADIGVIRAPLANYHHRVATTDGAGEYANTVTDGLNKHVAYDAIVRNRLMRRDLESGKIGLGWLVAFGRQMSSMESTTNNLRRAYRVAQSVLDRIPFSEKFEGWLK